MQPAVINSYPVINHAQGAGKTQIYFVLATSRCRIWVCLVYGPSADLQMKNMCVCMHACTWYLGHLLISIWRICVHACTWCWVIWWLPHEEYTCVHARVPGVWEICQLSCENACAWCLSHLHIKTMHTSVCLVFEPSAIWKICTCAGMYLVFGPSANLCEKCVYVVFGPSAMWRTCLYLVLGHLPSAMWRMCAYLMFGPSANFHAKNMHVCTWYLGHLHTTMWIYAHICHEECVYMHAIWYLGHLPTSVWRICVDAFMYSADFCEEYACVCVPASDFMCVTCASMFMYVMRASDVWATYQLQCEDSLCGCVVEMNHHIKKVFMWINFEKQVPFALCFTVAFVLAFNKKKQACLKRATKNI